MMPHINMNVRTYEPAPDTLIKFVEGRTISASVKQDWEPPRKRRRLATNHERRADYQRDKFVVLAQIDVDLIFGASQSEPFAVSPVSAHENEALLPVLIKKLTETNDGKFDFQLTTLDDDILFDQPVSSSVPPQAFRILQKAIHIALSKKGTSARAVFLISKTLGSEVDTDHSNFSIGVQILLQNSASLVEGHAAEQNELLNLCVPKTSSNICEPWSPRDFYDSVFVPDKNCTTANALCQVEQLKCQLYPFQKRAVQWMLQREGVQLRGNEMIPYELEKISNDLPHGFLRTQDANGRNCFVSHLLGIITTDENVVWSAGTNLRGGILAEEMGLGKTVEILALICLHRQIKDRQGQTFAGTYLPCSPATLIITPPSIIQQWKRELQTLAPDLLVLVYQGLRIESERSDNEQLLEELTHQDIVLTTYNVLAKEIHHSGAIPDRDLRYKKKYRRRLSPLTQLVWWRIVLDEAQMIESGVSNAAKVAQVIPRKNSWAVSGTPLKRDAKDLQGLLIFLQCEPYCYSVRLWDRLVSQYREVFKHIFGTLTLRHTKSQIKDDIQLPTQKRVVITVPFTQIEEQHYSTMYQQMCDDCGLDVKGSPLLETWNPTSPDTTERMRSWLTRLRQTCLHPSIGGQNRRALGLGEGPLRTISEVLEVMIEQNDIACRAEERVLMLSKIRRGQYLEHANQSHEALRIWFHVLEDATILVEECRKSVRVDAGAPGGIKQLTSSAQESEADCVTEARTGLHRQRLRAALEIKHMCTFFLANAYYQIKTNTVLTPPDSERFRELDNAEEEFYEKAKIIRNEMLIDSQSKAKASMGNIRNKAENQSYVELPEMEEIDTYGGIESRNILGRLEDLCAIINNGADQLDKWRENVIQLLSSPLVDQEDADLQGDEYEASKNQQDEAYVYFEALRGLVADRHDVLTGQRNILIEHETKFALEKAMDGEGHAPELLRTLLTIRRQLKPEGDLGSIRSIITDLRTLKTALRGQVEKGSTRMSAELAIVDAALQKLHSSTNEQLKATSLLDRELELFRDTMNSRLEYYRQLQQISDTVAPREDDLDGEALDTMLENMIANERRLQARTATLKARGRYLVHLRQESTQDDTPRLCVICQQPFEIGALTSCGHSYCKDCLRLWWGAHRNCPTCKKHLSRNDFHQITYKPKELTMLEELQPKDMQVVPRTEEISIYSGISNATLNQIKNIDVEGSFGTKIDTLARHILWIRENDPGAKSIVFSQFRDFLDILARAFAQFKIGFTGIDKKGGTERFKNDASMECFFLHAKAHSSGLNLVNATHVFLCEPLINTAIELQAIARVHRIGQHQPTTVWMYLVEDTVESSIYNLSVSRRMSHVGGPDSTSIEDSAGSNFVESSIEAANSRELQRAALSKLLTKGPGGGELVDKDDLWNCLFRRNGGHGSDKAHKAEMSVSRYQGADHGAETMLST